jgi:TRAP-type C4-dicarboxylate transport system substrate-binding protein
MAKSPLARPAVTENGAPDEAEKGDIMEKTTAVLLLAILLCSSCGGKNLEFSPPLSMNLTIPADLEPATSDLKEFARLAAERSRNTLIVTLTYSRAPAADRLTLKKLADGSIDLGCVSSQGLGSRQEEFAALAMPFLFRDDAHYAGVAGGEIGLGLLRSIEKDGLFGIGFIDLGALQFFSRDKVLLRPDDFKNKRFRIPQNPALRRYIERLGGFVSPVPDAQTPNSLKAGLIDAAADYLWACERDGLKPVAGRISLLACARSPFVLILSRSAVQKMPAGAVDFLRAAARDASLNGDGTLAYDERASVDRLKKQGVVIDEIGKKDAFASRAEGVYREQPEAVRKIIAKIQAAR